MLLEWEVRGRTLAGSAGVLRERTQLWFLPCKPAEGSYFVSFAFAFARHGKQQGTSLHLGGHKRAPPERSGVLLHQLIRKVGMGRHWTGQAWTNSTPLHTTPLWSTNHSAFTSQVDQITRSIREEKGVAEAGMREREGKPFEVNSRDGICLGTIAGLT
eukprot:256096-Chlamydomonas_euryale.AAC.7